MFKNKSIRAASLMLALALLLSCASFGTLAKYVSSTEGSDAATVAKWSFEVNDAEFATKEAQVLTFNLFETINEADTTTAEDSVSDGKLIAPGTGGSFELKIENLSQVDATYTLALTETNAGNVPVQYSLDKTTWYDTLAEINADQTDVAIAKESGSITETVYWRWNFEGGADDGHEGQTDVTDTALGIDAQSTAATVTIAAKLTATQVD